MHNIRSYYDLVVRVISSGATALDIYHAMDYTVHLKIAMEKLARTPKNQANFALFDLDVEMCASP